VTALLEIKGLTKAYPGVVANDDVSFSIAGGRGPRASGRKRRGQVDAGQDDLRAGAARCGGDDLGGAAYTPAEPRAARASGVAMVFQHFSLFEALSVAENIALGMEDPPKPRDLAKRIHDVSRAYGLPLDPGRMVGDLSAGERQRVEIIRCLLQDPKLLIMDEPTSVLTPQEVEILFHTLRKLSAEGTAILYISHKLEEIRTLCDAATILRLGKGRDLHAPRGVGPQMAEMMVGKSLSQPARAETEAGDVLLTVAGLTLEPASPFGTPLRHIGFEVRAGEILGIGGVAGNGQDELLAALSGERPVGTGHDRVQGRGDRRHGTRGAAPRLGLLCAPEERLGHAAAPDMSLTENAVLTGRTRRGARSSGFVGWGKARAFAEEIIERFDVRTPGPGVAARALSGGNLQKYVIGREILQAPEVLVVNQPTWGVDASAAAAIRQALLDLAQNGAAVVVISQDLDELAGGLRPVLRAERGAAVGAAPGARPVDGGDRPDAGRRP
jgi:ABC-type uncharacterized transport system ATPase subunit